MKWVDAQMAVFSALAALFVVALLSNWLHPPTWLLAAVGIATYGGYWTIICRLWSIQPKHNLTDKGQKLAWDHSIQDQLELGLESLSPSRATPR